MYKLALKKYFQMIICFSIIIPAIVYIRDPYMIFHKKWFNNNQIYNNLRIQNYGLIKYGNFDSIIIGTSMLENTSANEASEKLNGKFANLSISAGSFYERFKILNMANKYMKAKHVIFSLDYKFSRPNDINDTFSPNLYDEKMFSKVNTYATTKALKCIFFNHKCDMTNYSLDRPIAWYKTPKHNRRFGGFNNWIKYYQEDDQIQQAFKDLLNLEDNYEHEYKEYKQIIDNEILPVLRIKETKYSIIIPPYSTLWWAKRKNHLDGYFEAYAYLIEKTKNMPNVKIYWFYDDGTTTNISQYKDLTHYHYTHNSKQLDAIKNGTNIINHKNYTKKLNDFKQIIYRFNLEKYINIIQDVVYNNRSDI